MFTKEITGLTLANNVADKMFPNLNAEKFRNDESFIATLRALLYGRVPAEESVSVFRTSSRYRKNDIKDKKPTEAIKLFLQDRLEIFEEACTGKIILHSFDNTEEENNTSFELLDAWAAQGVDVTGYEPQEVLAAFFGQKKIKSRFYINHAKKNTLIFLERMDIKKWHIIQSVISKYLPWYFTADNPLTDADAKLVKSLVLRYAPDYEKCIEEFTSRFDFRTETIKLMLSGFETKFDKQKLAELEKQMQRQERYVEDARVNYIHHIEELDALNIKHIGLYTRIHATEENKDSEFLNYCLANKALNVLTVSDDGTIDFVVTTPIANYDPDMARRLINNTKSAFYVDYWSHNAYETSLTTEQLKALWTAIFVNEKFKLHNCAKYQIDFGNKRCYPGRNYEFSAEYKDYTPNQHILYYGCLGNNERHITKAIGEHDFINAINACVGSATNLNMSESNTISLILTDILVKNPDRKCIQLPSGERVTPIEAVEYLEQENKKKEAAKEIKDE